MGITMRYCKYCADELVNKRADAKFCGLICCKNFHRALNNKEAFKLSDHDKRIRRRYENE